MSAIEYVIAYAETARIHVHLVNVQPSVTADDVRVLAPAKVVAHMRRSAGEEALSRATALLDKAGFKHTSEVVFGTPAEAIVRSAAKHYCTRIVMGSKATGAVWKIFRDSVFSRVLGLAHVPITAIKVNMRRRVSGENKHMVEHHEARKGACDDSTPTTDIADFRMSAAAERRARLPGRSTHERSGPA
jgi:nucleotide-binding universal stress UspA family protein